MRYGMDRGVERRLLSLERRIRILSSLRGLVDLDQDTDITERQWSAILSHLAATESRLLSKLRGAVRAYLPYISEPNVARRVNEIIGDITLELTRAFVFFDTFMDILTQRHPKKLGMMLAGCDVIAKDAITKVGHPGLSLVEPPLVSIDRGFGARILRQGSRILPDEFPSPMSLIQIPYDKLTTKYDLTSILHEAGHEVMVRLDLVSVMSRVFRSWLAREHAPSLVGDLFGSTAVEIFCDFWGFCHIGSGAASSLRDILSLPQYYVYRISLTHPPPVLRVLLSFQFCRHLWGKGDWDDWEKEWLMLYPLDKAPLGSRRLLYAGKRYIATIAKALFYTKFRTLQWKTIPSFFDFSKIAPWTIDRVLSSSNSGFLDLKGLSPTVQLAVFCTMKDRRKLSEDAIDRLMTRWLIRLGQQRREAVPNIEMSIPILR